MSPTRVHEENIGEWMRISWDDHYGSTTTMSAVGMVFLQEPATSNVTFFMEDINNVGQRHNESLPLSTRRNGPVLENVDENKIPREIHAFRALQDCFAD